MTDGITLNISSLQDFAQCRWRWVAKWLENRQPHAVKVLQLGKVLHEVWEGHFRDGISMADACERVRAQQVDLALAPATSAREKDLILSVVEEFDDYIEVLSQWTDTFPAEGPILEVEQAFELPHPDDPSIRIRGRPDRMQALWGRTYHWQNRGLNRGVNFELYKFLQQRSLHEISYAWSRRVRFPDEDYGGTVFNLLRKLKYRGVPTKKDPLGKILHKPSELLWQGIMPVTDANIADGLRTIRWYADEMRRVRAEWRRGVWPAPNDKLNGGLYGNSIDPYFRVLLGQTTLDDPEYFEPREDTYAEERFE